MTKQKVATAICFVIILASYIQIFLPPHISLAILLIEFVVLSTLAPVSYNKTTSKKERFIKAIL
jgi:hypothetical protein